MFLLVLEHFVFGRFLGKKTGRVPSQFVGGKGKEVFTVTISLSVSFRQMPEATSLSTASGFFAQIYSNPVVRGLYSIFVFSSLTKDRAKLCKNVPFFVLTKSLTGERKLSIVSCHLALVKFVFLLRVDIFICIDLVLYVNIFRIIVFSDTSATILVVRKRHINDSPTARFWMRLFFS